jgi:pyridinium-3,5-biscarboxylic acid mononucleotide sulfurtransferase
MKSNELHEKELLNWFESAGSVLIGFSGGVDSTYLAAVALDALGSERTLAVIGRSASYPRAQWEAATAAARHIGLAVEEIDTEELEDPSYAGNPANRCYFCKSELWSKLVPIARSRGFATVVDGTNADDVSDWRPGAAAAREHGVRSPLAELGFGKGAIRELSRARGLPTWAQPSSPCLASRLPYGTPVTVPRLRRVERAEVALRAIGIEGDLRVRDEGELARVELDPSIIDGWLSGPSVSRLRDAVISAGYARVAIDLRGFRSGSLNVLHGVVSS